jgi:phytoene dehydrogenase-like protein
MPNASTPSTPRMLVIGGGVAGLSAGCFGQMNGFRTPVLESADRVGGLCTGWRRGGYTIDGCIRWLTGTVPRDPFHRIWRELGVIPGCGEMIRHDELVRVRAASGTELVVFADLERFAAHLAELSPGDADLIAEVVEQVRDLSENPTPLTGPRELETPGSWSPGSAWHLPLLRMFRRDRDDGSLEGFAARFRDPDLRRLFAAIFDVPGFAVLGAFHVLAALDRGDGRVPIGGSLALSSALEARYRALGGDVRCGSRVSKILVEAGRVTGVRLDDGSEEHADVVVSAADGRTTLFDMLDGRHMTQELRRWYRSLPIFPPLVQVSLGIARDLSGEPHMVRVLLDAPLRAAGQPVTRIDVKHFSYDPTLAPPGCSVVAVTFASSYQAWRSLAEDRTRYDEAKRRVAGDVVELLEHHFPGLTDATEVVDVATPVTWERRTGNWQGCPEGWVLTHQALEMTVRNQTVPRTLPGLRGFFMAGHWVEPGGGLPAAARSGREVIQLVCHAAGRPFRSEEP